MTTSAQHPAYRAGKPLHRGVRDGSQSLLRASWDVLCWAVPASNAELEKPTLVLFPCEESDAENRSSHLQIADPFEVEVFERVRLAHVSAHDCCSPALRLNDHHSMHWNYSKLNLPHIYWNRFRSAVASKQFESSALSRRGNNAQDFHTENCIAEFRGAA